MKITVKKQLKLNKYVRWGIIIVISFITVLMSVLLYRTVNTPVFKEEKIALYQYTHKADVKYRVFFKQNVLYSEESATEGNVFISEFVDYIRTFIKYEFRGERPANIDGTYEITAVVEGYRTEGQTIKSIWKKKHVLVPETGFQSTDRTVTIEREIPVMFEEYKNFTRKVLEDGKLSTEARVTVFWNIRIKANTDKGIVEEQIVPTMIIPMNTNYFEITGGLSQEKAGSIEETQHVQLPVEQNKVIVYGLSIGVLLIAAALLVIFTTHTEAIDSYKKKLKKIFKNHRNRLVAINGTIPTFTENYTKVKSMDDLVRISDEMGKPILYIYNKDFNHISEFYVVDDQQVYTFQLEHDPTQFDVQGKEANGVSEELLNNEQELLKSGKIEMEEPI